MEEKVTTRYEKRRLYQETKQNFMRREDEGERSNIMHISHTQKETLTIATSEIRLSFFLWVSFVLYTHIIPQYTHTHIHT
jgi:hypothetical protein